MPTMFVATIAVVSGFFLCLVARAWLQGCENRRMAAIAREEAKSKKKKR